MARTIRKGDRRRRRTDREKEVEIGKGEDLEDL